jgi:hypothetical protein
MNFLNLLFVRSLIKGAKEGAVHIIFPLLTAVLSVHIGEYTSRGSLNATNNRIRGFHQVHVPNSAHHCLKLLISIDKSTDIVMVG